MTPAEDDGKPMLRGAGDNLLKNFKKEPEIVPKIPDRHLFSGILYYRRRNGEYPADNAGSHDDPVAHGVL